MLSSPAFNSPYDTTALDGFVVDKLRKQILQSKITQNNDEYVAELKDFDGSTKYTIFGVMPQAESDIDAFTQPLDIEIDGDNRVIIDVRPFAKANRLGELNITSKSDYKLSLKYACLANAWMNEGQSLFTSINQLPAKVFTSWVSNAITRLLSLDPQYQIVTKCIVGMYFECLFDKVDGEYSIRDKQRIAVSVSKSVRLNARQVEDILDGVKSMYSVAELIEELRGQNDIFNNLTVANLFASVARSWFGAQSGIMSTVALEYPPALYVMIDYALNHAGFNKTAIGNIVWSDRNSPEARSFTTGVNRMYDDAKYV